MVVLQHGIVIIAQGQVVLQPETCPQVPHLVPVFGGGLHAYASSASLRFKART